MRTGKTRRISSYHQQRGAALLILLTIIILAASYTLLRRLNREPVGILRAADNARVLGEARTALVGYALKSGTRPGELPCPDTDNDGESDLSTGCTAYIGRLPWKTLGLSDPRDNSGERLWYALDSAFDGTTAINSDTKAGLVLDGDTSRYYAALIFAPGEPVLQSQARTAGAQNNMARYLEDDNADGDSDFVSTLPNDFNDQVVALGSTELMQAVERRVLVELEKVLKASPGSLPPPADNGASTCNPALQQGLLPVTPDGTCPAAALPAWPAWFVDISTGWQSLIWYAADPGMGISLKDGGSTTAGIEAVLISAGPALPTQNRGASTPPAVNTLLEGMNSDGMDLAFEKLPISAGSNDQIMIVQ